MFLRGFDCVFLALCDEHCLLIGQLVRLFDPASCTDVDSVLG